MFEMFLCACGCGKEPWGNKRFAYGHANGKRARSYPSGQLCACGCGEETLVFDGVVRKHLQGHSGGRKGLKGMPQIERMIAQIDAGVALGQGCWWWAGAVSPDGYGKFKRNGKLERAHRGVYEELVGPIKEGLVLDHLCKNLLCVNPDHLEPVTHRENLLRSPATQASLNLAKTHCKRGHEFTPENTYVPPGTTLRKCKQCRSIATKKSYTKKRSTP